MRSKFMKRLLTSLVISSALGVSLWFILLTISGLYIQTLWSEASMVFGLYILIPAYITVFAIITWTMILMKK